MSPSRTLTQYLAGFALALVLPILIGSLIVTYHYATAEKNRLEALTDNANQDIVTLIDRELSTRAAMLQALSTARSLQTGELVRFEEQARELSSVTAAHIVLFDLNGQQLVNTHVEHGLALPRASDPNLIETVTNTKTTYVSNLFVGAATVRQQIQVAVPVMRDGAVIAVLSSTLKPERLVELLRDGLPPGPFYATILDRAGVVVARSISPEGFIGKPFPVLAEASRGSKGSVSLQSSSGIPVFAFYRRPAQSGWVIATAVEQTALRAPLYKGLQVLAFSTVVLVVMAVGGASWIGRKLTRAHATLVAAAQEVGKGRVIEAPVTRLRQADLVGRALSRASVTVAKQAGALRRANRDLEMRVAARTRELATKNAILETTLDTMKQGLIVIDETGHIPVCNRNARSMLDLPDELFATPPASDDLFRYQEIRGEFDGVPAHVLRALNPKPGDGDASTERQRPNGTILHIETAAIPAGGGFVRTVTDVTAERRQAGELETARHAAEQANQAKGDFLATISHEMRTPLNAVIGYAELLLDDGGLPPGSRHRVERIQSAGAALLCLVEDVLDIGKIEAGIVDVRTEPFDLNELVQDAIAMVRPAAEDKGLHLTAEAGEIEQFFLGDRHRLRQILLNLLNNAVKFTPHGGVQLSVDTAGLEDGLTKLRFCVADTGIGIAKEDQAELFQRFHQLDRSISRSFGGAGLGLAISKQLVEHMGGSIGVDSGAGEGSSFWFEVSLQPTAAVAPRKRHRMSSLAGARVLVAEDVAINQELMRELMERAGYLVEVVSNGAEAVEAVKSGCYDLVLMDVSMPHMDGLTATRLIREAGEKGESTPIVACTANVLPDQLSALQEAGINAFLRKPLRRAELIATIERVLMREEDETEAGKPTLPAPADPDGFWNLVSLLGPARVIAALDGLADELSKLTLDDPADGDERKKLAEQAHAVISTASLLELTDLAESCRDLENACRKAVGVANALERLRPVIRIALTQGTQLRSDLQRRAA